MVARVLTFLACSALHKEWVVAFVALWPFCVIPFHWTLLCEDDNWSADMQMLEGAKGSGDGQPRSPIEKLKVTCSVMLLSWNRLHGVPSFDANHFMQDESYASRPEPLPRAWSFPDLGVSI